MTPFQLVSKSLQCTYELLGQKGGSIPDTVELTVTDLSISFNNINDIIFLLLLYWFDVSFYCSDTRSIW